MRTYTREEYIAFHEGRKARGRALVNNVTRHGPVYYVKSQSSAQVYIVDPMRQTCTCPDYQRHEAPCKHIWAVKLSA